LHPVEVSPLQVVNGNDQPSSMSNAGEKLAQRLERATSQQDGFGDRQFAALPTRLGY
jgi:hypothetical protein